MVASKQSDPTNAGNEIFQPDWNSMTGSGVAVPADRNVSEDLTQIYQRQKANELGLKAGGVTFTSVTPRQMRVGAEATTFTVTGTNLDRVETIYLNVDWDGGTVTHVSDTEVTFATTREWTQGSYDLHLYRNNNTRSNPLAVVSDAVVCTAVPTFEGVAPVVMLPDGVSRMFNIWGTHMETVHSVRLESGTNRPISRLNNQLIRVFLHETSVGSGPKDLVFQDVAGTDFFTVEDAVTIVGESGLVSITPHTGVVTGGTHVVLTGGGFTGATSVGWGSPLGWRIDAYPEVISDTEIHAVTPDMTVYTQEDPLAVPVDVRVRFDDPAQDSTLTDVFTFTEA